MSILFPAILLAVAVVFFVLHPVAVGLQAPMDAEEEEFTNAQHRKKVTLLALRDVEYDFQAGKLDEADYVQMKRELAEEALDAIDREEAEWRVREGARNGGARVVGGNGGGADSAGGRGAIEQEIAALRASIREGVVCSLCAHPNPRGSRFCGDCGAALPAGSGG